MDIKDLLNVYFVLSQYAPFEHLALSPRDARFIATIKLNAHFKFTQKNQEHQLTELNDV